jgi:hypothetical protein
MKTIFKLLTLAVIALFITAGSATAVSFNNNITIYDEDSVTPWVGDGQGVGWEDDESEPGTARAQIWDLEAFYLTDVNGNFGGNLITNKLTAVGGFDPVNGEGQFDLGDIFVSTDSDLEFGEIDKADGGHKSTFTPSGGGVENYTWGYEWVFDMDYGTGTYDLIALHNQSVSVVYDINTGSNPYKYAGGGIPVVVNAPIMWGLNPYAAGTIPGLDEWTELGNDGKPYVHYAFAVDIQPIIDEAGIDSPFWFHLTQECGNDNLMGKGSPEGGSVPEPPVMALLGMALFGMAGIGRKIRKK